MSADGAATHRIELWEPGTLEGARFICEGTDADLCRQWCGEGCEEWCDPRRTAHGRLVGKHTWVPIGSCRIADWLDATGAEDAYGGIDDDLRWDPNTDTRPGIRPGRIEAEWTGDDYVWRYAEPAPEPEPEPAVAPAEPIDPNQLALPV